MQNRSRSYRETKLRRNLATKFIGLTSIFWILVKKEYLLANISTYLLHGSCNCKVPPVNYCAIIVQRLFIKINFLIHILLFNTKKSSWLWQCSFCIKILEGFVHWFLSFFLSKGVKSTPKNQWEITPYPTLAPLI